MNNKGIHITSFVLVVIGAINWGLIGLIEFDLIGLILGSVPAIERIVYVLVGLAGVYLLATHKSHCKTCGSKGNESMSSGAPTPPSTN